MSLTSASVYISPNDPIFNQIQTDTGEVPPQYSGLVRNGIRFGPRTDLPTPLTSDESSLVTILLGLDIPDDPRNSFRNKANSIVGCGRLVRRAECPHGDEIRIYYVYCGQGTLCRRCGGGKARAQALKYTAPDLYKLIDSERCDVQTFSIHLGCPCYELAEFPQRIKRAKTFYKLLRNAINRELDVQNYGAKVSFTINPSLHSLEFRVLWQNMPLPFSTVKKLWTKVCARYYPDAHASATSQRFEAGSAAKALHLLLSGTEAMLLRPAEDRLPWALVIGDEHTSSVCGIFRGQKLAEATEWMAVATTDDDPSDIPPELSKHGACSVHHEAMKMTQHAATTIGELERSPWISRIYFGPITVYRDKLHSTESQPTHSPPI